MQQQQRVYIPVVGDSSPTFTLGVFASKKEARLYVIELMRKQSNFVTVETTFYDEFGLILSNFDNEALYEIIYGDYFNYAIFFQEILLVEIEEVNVRTLFDFRLWYDWNSDNLYDTLDMVLRGQTGMFADFPRRTNSLFFNNL